MQNTLTVTADKSHLVTIGERLYGESIEFIRELVNNAYDAYITRLVTQEISLMKDPKNPRQAFERQSKLLCDALVDK